MAVATRTKKMFYLKFIAMKKTRLEAIIIISYMLLCVLAKIGLPFVGVLAIFSMPIVVGLLIYVEVVNANLKTEALSVIFSLYYKILFISTLLFALKDYPGKYVLIATALISALLYIIYVAISKVKRDKIITALLYMNVFSAILVILIRA